MTSDALARRYRSLWIGEAVSIFLFTFLYLRFALADGQWSNWIVRGYSLFVVVVILLQGTLWWVWKLRVLQAGEREVPARVLRWFRRCKWLNWLLIGLFPVVLFLKWWLTDELWSSSDAWFGTLFICGALLEQINYYYYQLMYDSRYDWQWLRTHRRLRRGNIGKALAQLPA